MQALLNSIKKILPAKALKKIRPFGHGFLAYLGAVIYKFPSSKMIVIGITGTAGKSTTTRFLASILNAAGHKAGYITTVNFFDGDSDHINKHGLSMPGRFMLQRGLAQMLKNGCKYAIVECTSEGLAQNRHNGIDFDVAIITNLAEAHLDSHGGFDNYKSAKAKLFKALERSSKKTFFKDKIIGVNLDDQNFEYFLRFKADRKFGISIRGIIAAADIAQTYKIEHFAGSISSTDGKTSLKIASAEYLIDIAGEFNAGNALMAIAASEMLGVKDTEAQQRGLAGVSEIPGRMQEIKNDKGVRVFLDYAPEPVAMQNALLAVSALKHKRIIHVFGSTGGHRDVAKRFEFGKISAASSDVIIVTNDDVYDSDPEAIAADIFFGIAQADKKKVKERLMVLDRSEAIKKAAEIGRPGDIILITGKGSEQFLVLPGNQRIEWDEKSVIEKAL